MAQNILTIKLTDDQQKQIKDATGRSVAEINIDIGALGPIDEKALEDVAGGATPWVWPEKRTGI